MKKLLAVFLTIFSFNVFGADFSEPREYTYAVLAMIPGKPQIFCSAVAVSDRTLLTAAHCIPVDINIGVAGKEGDKIILVEVVKVDPQKDLALLTTKNVILPEYAQIAPGSPQLDSDVVTVGYPLGGGEIVTTGHLVDRRAKFDVVTSPVIYGNSGGGTFIKLDERWYLIGILSRVALVEPNQAVTHLAIIVKWEFIKEFLGGN